MKRYFNLILATATGILLWASWPVSPFTLLIFIAWIPLLWVETRVHSRKKFFGLTYIAMFIWNIATTWWIWNASPPGAVGAFLANSLIMCLPWWGFKTVKKWLGEKIGYASLVTFWMCFEFIHLTDWGLSWPWLTLGNVFATHSGWVQWYEFTGTSGGTLWILLVNLLLFIYLKKTISREPGGKYKYLGGAIAAVLIPIVFSSLTPDFIKRLPVDENVVIVQPNIDPYLKISDEAGSFESQLQKLISLSEKAIDSNTKLVVWPETAMYMSSRIDEENLKENFFLNPLWNFLRRHPQVVLFTGIESYRRLDQPTRYSQEYNGEHYESYNGSVVLDSSGARGFYHKSMLVPGVETLPWFLRFIDKWFEKFGGTTAGYARQKERTVLPAGNNIQIAPSICYESIYGEYMSKYIKNGANLICIITNDGWWGNTPGYKQHMSYARLRAIETRTYVVRSANTGISCVINSNGWVEEKLPWDTGSAIKRHIPLGRKRGPTFFVRNGDILSRIMILLSAVFIIWVIIIKVRKKLQK